MPLPIIKEGIWDSLRHDMPAPNRTRVFLVENLRKIIDESPMLGILPALFIPAILDASTDEDRKRIVVNIELAAYLVLEAEENYRDSGLKANLLGYSRNAVERIAHELIENNGDNEFVRLETARIAQENPVIIQVMEHMMSISSSHSTVTWATVGPAMSVIMVWKLIKSQREADELEQQWK